MPHIIIKMFPGRDDNAKTALAEEVAKTVSHNLNIDINAVSVSCIETPKEEWQNVYDTEIMGAKDTLYFKPNY